MLQVQVTHFLQQTQQPALRAAELSCSAIYKATQVDGIYNKDPKKYKNAKKYDKITYKKYLNEGLKVMDSSAITVAQDNNIPIIEI